MPPSKSFEDVVVWQRAHALVLDIYRYSARFPNHEVFGLSAQLRRAAVSVPANFAEGFKRQTRADKIRCYNIAQASLEECRYYLRLSEDLGYGKISGMRDALEEVSRLLEAYMRRLREADSRT
jgi:four helix bundle protein